MNKTYQLKCFHMIVYTLYNVKTWQPNHQLHHRIYHDHRHCLKLLNTVNGITILKHEICCTIRPIKIFSLDDMTKKSKGNTRFVALTSTAFIS